MKKVIFICCLFCLFFSFSCRQKAPAAPEADNAEAGEKDIAYTEIDFYGEWYCETPPQKITESFETAGTKNTYIFYDNNTFETNFIVIGQEDSPLKNKGQFSISNSDIIITRESLTENG